MASKDKHIKYRIKKSNQKQVTNCDKKKRHNSEVMAMAAALSQKEFSDLDYDLFYYKCGVCNGFHLTRNSGGGSILAT